MNTKSDIGPCPFRHHDEYLKEQFEAKGESYREEYERDFLTFLEGLVNDLERRLKRGKERLEVRPNDPSVTNVHSINDETEEKRILLDLQVKELLAKIETFGEEGRIREAQELTIQVDTLKTELDQLKGSVDFENPLHKLEKRMEVCSTCGAFLVMNDAPKRIGAHFDGRQHSGWVKLREAVELLRQKWSLYQRRGPERRDRERDYKESHYDEREHDRDFDRYKERDSDRSLESRDRDRDRDREHGRDRDRDRSYRRDSRDDRDYRERDSRDREPKESRDRSDRDRSSKDFKSEYHRDERNDSRGREYNKRKNSDDSQGSRDPKRPSFDNYIPGDGLDYELGEIIEEGEI